MIRSFSTALAGAGFNQNPAKVVGGEILHLERDPSNPVHCNAIAVLNMYGERAGWIPRDLADFMSPAIRQEKIKIVGCVAESKNVIQVFFEA
jgi:hypothetical protein